MLAQMRERVDDDPAILNRIKHTISGAPDHEAAHRRLKYGCEAWMTSEVLQHRVELESKALTRTFAAIFKLHEIRSKSSSAPRFQTISGMPPFQQTITQFFPPHAALRFRLMLAEPSAQQLHESRVFLLFQHDLIQKLLGQKLFLLRWKCQDIGQAFDDHARNVA